MFIIYGTRGKENSGKYVTSIPCKHCGKTSLSSYGGTRYFHIFWIPLFITSRIFGLVCSNCNGTMEKEDLSSEQVKRVKQTLFTPLNTLPYFTGTILIVLLALFIFWSGQESAQHEVAMLHAPQVNDVYRADMSKVFPDMDVDKYKYAAMKIVALEKDGILFAIGNEAYEKDAGLRRKIRKEFPEQDGYYVDSGILLPYGKVIELYNNKAIVGIHRFSEVSADKSTM